jgi:membrane protease YdiL (CAAX protease family)
MNYVDHTLVFIIAVVYPIVGFVSFRRLLRRVAAGETVKRTDLYRNTLISHWTLLFITMALWAYADRGWADIGFSLDLNLWFGVGVILTILGIVALAVQNRHVRAYKPDELKSLREQFSGLEIIIPQNGNELARFYGLSITAGIVEEIIWRGFLIWYFSLFMPLWAAAVLSAVGFGLAHAYQGAKHLPHVTAVGAAFTVLYLVSGSIWLPIIMHAAVDILQGRMAYDVINQSEFAAALPDQGHWRSVRHSIDDIVNGKAISE